MLPEVARYNGQWFLVEVFVQLIEVHHLVVAILILDAIVAMVLCFLCQERSHEATTCRLSHSAPFSKPYGCASSSILRSLDIMARHGLNGFLGALLDRGFPILEVRQEPVVHPLRASGWSRTPLRMETFCYLVATFAAATTTSNVVTQAGPR